MHGDVAMEDPEGSTQMKQGQATHVGALVVPSQKETSFYQNLNKQRHFSFSTVIFKDCDTFYNKQTCDVAKPTAAMPFEVTFSLS
jgi:hypothetical protein